ncbi:MAG: prepilin-type N-terminal cleavage/methylation domain-containing protein, partial [Burkholderiaceae bacterium]
GQGRGFTLLEMLVVLVLLSLLMLGLAGALRTVGQAGEKIDQRLAQSDDFRVVSTFLRNVLGEVSGRKVDSLQAQTAGGRVVFAGAPDALAWIGVMPARYGAGGRTFFKLGVEPVAGRRALVLRFVPWFDGPGFPDWSNATARALVGGVSAFSVSYENGRVMPSEWVPGWPVDDRLPDRVNLRITTENGAWPELVIPMRALPSSERGGDGGFVVGDTQS